MAIAKRPPPEMFKLSSKHLTQPIWDGAARHKLVAALCTDSGSLRLQPTPFCPLLPATALPLERAKSAWTGQVYTYTIFEYAIFSEWGTPVLCAGYHHAGGCLGRAPDQHCGGHQIGEPPCRPGCAIGVGRCGRPKLRCAALYASSSERRPTAN